MESAGRYLNQLTLNRMLSLDFDLHRLNTGLVPIDFDFRNSSRITYHTWSKNENDYFYMPRIDIYFLDGTVYEILWSASDLDLFTQVQEKNRSPRIKYLLEIAETEQDEEDKRLQKEILGK